MSKLAVGQIEGLASEGYKITVPTGSKIVQTGAVLQVVSTTKTDTFSTSSTTFTDITGLSATITPSSTSSKILVVANLGMCNSDTSTAFFRLSGGNTATGYVGAAAGSRIQTVYQVQGQNIASGMFNQVFSYLDSPNTIAATTYSVQCRLVSGTHVIYVNRTFTDTDSTSFGRGASSITVMEIGA